MPQECPCGLGRLHHRRPEDALHGAARERKGEGRGPDALLLHGDHARQPGSAADAGGPRPQGQHLRLRGARGFQQHAVPVRGVVGLLENASQHCRLRQGVGSGQERRGLREVLLDGQGRRGLRLLPRAPADAPPVPPRAGRQAHLRHELAAEVWARGLPRPGGDPVEGGPGGLLRQHEGVPAVHRHEQRRGWLHEGLPGRDRRGRHARRIHPAPHGPNCGGRVPGERLRRLPRHEGRGRLDPLLRHRRR
mmetsp:Transcript_98943/g.255804  ORF Transcript_98943/g.255804 Transcript_98943/m.255804 type:complete len:249 (-) Transcript_98943:152-898(-)